MSICDRSPGDAARDGLAPLVQVRGSGLTPDELAALVCVVIARQRPVETAAPPAGSHWARSGLPTTRAPGLPASPGPDAWRRSGLPG